MIKTILVATDGSDHAGKAVDLAADIAGKYGARLVLLHVLLRDASAGDVLAMPLAKALSDEVKAELERLAAAPIEAAAAAGAYIDVRVPVPAEILHEVGNRITAAAQKAAGDKGVTDIGVVIGDGDPAKRILAAAAAEGADTIVLGSRGLGNIRGMLVGSVSHKVGHLAPCTCITVK
jgi:nucleotide-binding universal stress UspA family protein